MSSVKNLGVTLDLNLSMSQHISNTCKAAYIQITHISSIRHLLTTQATQTLVCSLVLSRLDYCNSLLSGCPQYLLDKLQKVQNAAARLVCKAKKSDHIHPILETLHWLPVTHHIQYKISTICFNSISGTAPQYLSDLLQPYTPAGQLQSASDTQTFVTATPPQFLSDLLQPYTPAGQLQSASDTQTFVTATPPQFLSDLLQPYTPAGQLQSASDTQTFVTTTPPSTHKNIW